MFTDDMHTDDMHTDDMRTDDTAWELTYAAPLGPGSSRLVLRPENGSVRGYVESWEGWVPVEGLEYARDSVSFTSNAWIVPIRFRFPVVAGRVSEEGEAFVELPVAGADGECWARLKETTVTDVRPVSASPWLHADAPPYYGVARERAPLAGYTLYRPIENGAFPVVVWGNGGARASNEEFITFLTQIAARGFAVLAAGPPEGRFRPPIGDMRPDVLLTALDWLARSDREAERVGLDAGRVAVMGQSAGAGQAWHAAGHPLVRALAAWNGATGAISHLAEVAGTVRVPTMIVTGGATDIATAPAGQDWARLAADLPAVWANHSEAGHIGLFHGTNDPFAIQSGAIALGQEVGVQASRLAVAWLEWALNGRTDAAEVFTERDAALSTLRFWTVHSRNIG